MRYAKVVVGVPVEGPFDYIVPPEFVKKLKTGMRVKVNFAGRNLTGYVVGFSSFTTAKKLKSVLTVLDQVPVLDSRMRALTKYLSRYYCCSWGEAIETALPEGLRRGALVPNDSQEALGRDIPESEPQSDGTMQAIEEDLVLIHDCTAGARWEIYNREIKKTLLQKKSIIMILPDVQTAAAAQRLMERTFGVNSCLLYRKQPREIEAWAAIKKGNVPLVIGTRSAIFAPLPKLGLMVVEDEQEQVYKQDQVPHYHVREVALYRSRAEKARLILGSGSPSLESMYQVRKHKMQYIFMPRKAAYPEIKVIDMKVFVSIARKKNILFSKYLEDSLFSALTLRQKSLLFLNRRGFATSAQCQSCGHLMRCPRCAISLVYHFDSGLLKCHHCNYSIAAPRICPQCNIGYITYLGVGVEKLESELARLFPQARLKHLEAHSPISPEESDIFISTSAVFKSREGESQTQPAPPFDVVGVLAIDNALGRIDFRAGEKAFGNLAALLGLAKSKLVIQTYSPAHHCFSALEKKDVGFFYDAELRFRKELGFPPYRHFCAVKVRARIEERAKEACQDLFQRLGEANKDTKIKIVSHNPGIPPKLRGNYYYQIVIKADSALRISRFLKLHLKDAPHSGIIVTVDMDPL